MKRLDYDVADILHNLLKNSDLVTEASGELCKDGERPAGSTLEDVVINTLGITGDQIQACVANVNIYVPNLTILHNGQSQQVPHTARLKQLARLAMIPLVDGFGEDWRFYLSHQHTFPEPDMDCHYVNLRIEFQLLP